MSAARCPGLVTPRSRPPGSRRRYGSYQVIAIQVSALGLANWILAFLVVTWISPLPGSRRYMVRLLSSPSGPRRRQPFGDLKSAFKMMLQLV